jgi:DNA-binding transcriptional LysR family regulator
MTQALAALTEVSAQPGEVLGRVRLSVRRTAVPFVITPVLPTFRARHPHVDVDVCVEERLVEIVGEGYDAGVRLTEAIERDMCRCGSRTVAEGLHTGRLRTVLESYAPTVPGFFLYYPPRAELARAAPLRRGREGADHVREAVESRRVTALHAYGSPRGARADAG